MNVPRLKYKGQFFVVEGDSWRPATSDEVVYLFNVMAERYQVVLEDIEEIVNGYQSRTSTAVRPRTASTA